MKRQLLLLLSLVPTILFSQTVEGFGTDVIIQSAATIDQREPAITAAFNGWLYSAFTTVDSVNNSGGITIRKSTDKGITWQTIDSYTVTDVRYEDVEVEVAGTDTNNLTLFLFGINHGIGAGTYVAFLDRYNATTGIFIGSSFNYSSGINAIYDLDIATDYQFPAVGASPYSVGLIISRYSPSLDSIVFYSSVNGGANFTYRTGVATTGAYFGKVSLSYGRSSSASNGRYFAAWERKSTSTARNGNIYTSRSTSTVDGPWVTPINLDSVSSTMIGLCRNPRIAVQANDIDNDSNSTTAIVLVDRDYNGNATDYDLLGFYNKRAHYTNFWYRLDVLNTSENDIQPDIIYEADSNKFHATYYDSTNFQLRYVKQEMNLTNPSTWTVTDVQYNDAAPGTNPFPRITYSKLDSGVAAVWTMKGVGTKGVSMFDAKYRITLTAGVDENGEPSFDITSYPNPTTDYVNINLEGLENVRGLLLNNNGQVIETFNNVTDNYSISLFGFASGIYYLQFEHNGKTLTQKIIKN